MKTKTKHNGFEKIAIPNFVFEDGSEDLFIGSLRSYESDVEKNKGCVRFFDEEGNYYSILFDNRAAKKLKRPTFLIGSKAHHYRIVGTYRCSCRVNPDNGHLLVPHNCDDQSCKTKLILFGSAS